jgi:hypothetical protein
MSFNLHGFMGFVNHQVMPLILIFNFWCVLFWYHSVTDEAGTHGISPHLYQPACTTRLFKSAILSLA